MKQRKNYTGRSNRIAYWTTVAAWVILLALALLAGLT